MRRARTFAIVFFAAYLFAMIFPGIVPFRGPRPFVLGVPLAMAWTTAWIVASFFVLLWLDRTYSAGERMHEAADGSHGSTAHPTARKP